MTKKHIITAIIFVVLAAFIFGGALLYQQHITAGQVRGEYAFEHTRNNIKQLARIRMTTPEYGEINIYYKDGDWHFKEAKDYFINVHRLADFYNMINNSLIEAVHPADKEEMKDKELAPETATKITTYDNNDNTLDELFIGKTSDEPSHYAYNPQNKHYYYIISEVGAFSGKAPDWVPYPLLTIENRHISSIKVHNNFIGREKINELMRTSLTMRHVLDALSLIGYDGVALKSDLAADTDINATPRYLEITMANGLIYEFEIYNIEDTYWLGVTLKSAHIAQKNVTSFITDNQKYFADWLFLMDPLQGQILYEM